MDTTPLPTEECDSSDGGFLLHYVIRITPYDKFTVEQLHEFLKQESEITRYVVAVETIPRVHFHLVLSTELDLQEVKDIIRAFICPFWQTDQGKMPKGFGNKQYNAQLSDDLNQAVSYAVKESTQVFFEGFTPEYIESRRAESFLKKKPSDFKSEYTDLCDKFQESDMDIDSFMEHFVNLKAKYGQQVVLSSAYATAISNHIKRDNNAKVYVKDFLSKYKNASYQG